MPEKIESHGDEGKERMLHLYDGMSGMSLEEIAEEVKKSGAALSPEQMRELTETCNNDEKKMMRLLVVVKNGEVIIRDRGY